MANFKLHIVSTVGTVVIQALVVGALVSGQSCSGTSEAAAPDFANAVTIEAALAYRAPEKKKKTRQPQKPKKAVVPEKVTKVTRSDEKIEKPKKEKKPPRGEPVPDLKDILSKNAGLEEDDARADSEEDSSDDPLAGSRWGYGDKSRGNPYVGELKSRIARGWNYPKFDKTGGVALGCVRLDTSGKIAARKLFQPSGNAKLDSSVEEALRTATDMQEAVPEELTRLLVKKGVCFRFDPAEQ